MDEPELLGKQFDSLIFNYLNSANCHGSKHEDTIEKLGRLVNFYFMAYISSFVSVIISVRFSTSFH